jgi:hypothetical protein
LKEPNSGGPFVVTNIDADDGPQESVNFTAELDGSILLLITKLTIEFSADSDALNGDEAARLRAKVALLMADHWNKHTTFVVTFPISRNLVCGFT